MIYNDVELRYSDTFNNPVIWHECMMNLIKIVHSSLNVLFMHLIKTIVRVSTVRTQALVCIFQTLGFY